MFRGLAFRARDTERVGVRVGVGGLKFCGWDTLEKQTQGFGRFDSEGVTLQYLPLPLRLTPALSSGSIHNKLGTRNNGPTHRGKYCEYRPQICVHGDLLFFSLFQV